MVKIKRKIIYFILLLLAITIFFFTTQRIYAAEKEGSDNTDFHSVCIDEANLLTAQEKDALIKTADTIGKETKWNIVIATVADAKGETTQTIGEELFNANTLGDNGITCIIDMDNREIYINTMGTAISYLTDKRIASITDHSYQYATDENYNVCFESMLKGIQTAYEKGIPDNLVIYNTTTGKRQVIHRLTISEIAGAGIAAFACGILFFLFILAKYKMKLTEANYDYQKDTHLRLEQKEDQFLYQDIMHRHIPQNKSGLSGGGSTTHTGSGGRTSGGGGHRF